MRRVPALVVFVMLLALACGGNDSEGTGKTEATGPGGGMGGAAGVTIAAADADRVARAAMPALTDLPGEGWVLIAEDEFDEEGGPSEFLAFIEGKPECERLENLAALENVFGSDEDAPAGRAQVQYEQASTTGLIGTTLEVEVKVEAGSGNAAAFQVAKGVFESDETANCLIAALNHQFGETAPEGIQFKIERGARLAEAPNDGVHIAFDIVIDFAGLELPMAMQMFIWPYGNAMAQVLFVGDKSNVTSELLASVLSTIDTKLKAAAHR